ncbi:MAG: hypothetical protein ABIQ95_12320 [Bdellovibrionia bacterium]
MDQQESSSIQSSNLVKIIVAGLIGVGLLVATISSGFFSDYRAHSVATWQKYSADINDVKSRLKTLGKEIKIARGKSVCKRDLECQVLGLGAKQCGKFKDFLVYSTVDSNEPKLLELVKEFNLAHEGLMDKAFSIRKCGVDPVPILCVNKLCRPQ